MPNRPRPSDAASDDGQGRMVKIGRIVGPVGLQGRMRVDPLTDFLERFDSGSTVFIEGNPRVIADCTWHGRQARLLLEGTSTIEAVETLRWKYLEVPSSWRPKLEKDEYLSSDLVGMTLVTPEGETIGTVDEVVFAPANHLLRSGDTLIPAVKQFVKKVDMKGRRIVVELIEGMRPGDSVDEVR